MNFEELYKNLKEVELDLMNLDSGFTTSNNLKEHLKSIRDYIFDLSLKVFLASKKEDKYWSHCSASTYNKTYSDRLKDALDNDNNNIHNEIEFIESEIKQLKGLRSHFSNSSYHPDLFNPLNKKIGLLEFKLQELSPKNREESLDFSDSSALEKVVFLHRTGILDFLRKQSPFNSSTNRLAQFLSSITGEKTVTLQSYLNPIYSQQADQKRNPLHKKSTVEKVEKHLNTMGIS